MIGRINPMFRIVQACLADNPDDRIIYDDPTTETMCHQQVLYNTRQKGYI